MKTSKQSYKYTWHNFWIIWHETKYHYYGSRWHEKKKLKHEQKMNALSYLTELSQSKPNDQETKPTDSLEKVSDSSSTK